jgi:PAS domain S-box-containing protein
LTRGSFAAQVQKLKSWLQHTNLFGNVAANEAGTAQLMNNGYVAPGSSRKGERSLRATNALQQPDPLGVTLENMDQGLMMIDAEGIVQVYNKKALELLDLPEELMSRRPSFEEVRSYQLERDEFVKSDESFRQWVNLSGIRNVHHTYERERPDGTVLEIRTVPLPGGGAVRTYTDITVRRRAEADLRNSEERYRALVAASSSIIWRAAPNGAILEGDGFQQFSDEFLEHYKGYGWLDAVHPEDLQKVKADWQAALASGEPTSAVYRARSRSGQYRWVAARCAPLKNPDGSVREWVGTLTDIHDRKSVEEELARSEERYRLAAQATNDALWDWDLANDRTYWSEAVTTLFGYGKGDIEPSAAWWKERIHPAHREQVLAGMEEVLSSEAAHWSAEYCFRRADGSYADVLDRGSVMRDGNGQPLRMVGAMLDQTERRKAEKALHESEARYRLLAENATDIITRADLNGVCTYSSPVCREILDCEPEELVGTPQTYNVHPDDLEVVVAALEALASGATEEETVTFRLRHKDGNWVWIEARQRLVRDPKGKPCEVVSVLRDVTRRRALEAQLHQSQKMEAVGQLTGGIAHDFNNLLTVIIGNIEIIRDFSSDDKLKSFADMSLEAAERGASLTQQLLAFGRRQSLKPEPLRIDQVVGSMVGLLGRTLGELIEIRIETDQKQAPALADRSFLESAILNLVVNARDAMPQGGVLTITTGARLGGPDESELPIGQPVVFITISDTGVGMSPEVLERAFEPFFTTKDIGKGTGLGLSMVYGFVEQSGGHVRIESKVGEGTSVTLVLRAVQDKRASPPPEEEVSPAPVEGRERVLVVEDEPQVLTFVSSQLESLGYEVIGVTCGPDALKVLEQDRSFDLLFTDVVLPHGLSGVELAIRVREMGLETKVLLTSGYSEEVFEHHGRPTGNTLLLRKPYRKKQLAETVRKALAQAA